jgi:hypothetical protein
VTFYFIRLKHPLDSQAVGNALYGMQSMSSEHKPVRELLAAIYSNITQQKNSPPLCMKAQEISNAIYGMQKMDATDSEVQDVLMLLHQQLVDCKESVSGLAVGNIIFGLQSKTCDHKVIRDILHTVSGRVQQLSEPLSIVSFGSALYGLHCMSSDVTEVREVLASLCDHLTPDITSNSYGREVAGSHTRSIVNALYGMQCMDSEHLEVRRVLALLSARLEVCSTTSMTAQGFGNAMYGLQLMACRDDHPEVEAVFQALYDKANASPKKLIDVRAVGNSLYGLISSMKYQTDGSSKKLLIKIVTLLLDAADDIVASITDQKENLLNNECSISIEDMQDLWRSLVLFSHFTESSAALTPDLKSHMVRLCSDLSKHAPHSTLHVISTDENGDNAAPSESKARSGIERRVQEQVNIILQQNPTVHITHNEMLYGFESDIVLRVTSVESSQQQSRVPDIIRNVEVDGITHLQPRKRKFCNLRDIYLEDKYGIKVSRIRVPDRRRLSDEALHDAVLEHLKALKLFVITQQTQHTFF